MNPRVRELLVPLLLVAATFGLYGSFLTAAWTHDDPYIVRHVLAHTPAELALSPSAWRDYNPMTFFPLQLWSFKLDSALFGIAIPAYRVHQLLSLAAVAYFLYRVGRDAATELPALVAALVFLLGPITAGMAEKLMTRHYVEGAVLALGATLAFLRAERARHPGRWAALAAVLFLLSVLAKEVYAPLPAVLFFCGRSRERWRHYLLLLSALPLAVLYRLYMVGAFARVYRPDIWTPDALWQNAIDLARRAPLVLIGGEPGLRAAVAVLGGVLILGAIATAPRAGGRMLASAIATVSPALLVAESLDDRHLFPAWILVALALGWSASRLGALDVRALRIPLVATGVLIVALLGVTNRRVVKAELDEARLYTRLWEFVFRDGHPGDCVLMPEAVLGYGYHYAALSWMRRHAGDGEEGPEVVVAEEQSLCAVELPPSLRRFRYDGKSVVPDPDFDKRLQHVCLAFRRDEPFEAKVAYRGLRLTWDLQPFAGPGTYSALVMRTNPYYEVLLQSFPFPREGTLWQLPDRGRLRLRFLYRSAQGWFAVSPEIDLPLMPEGSVAP
jgi:hypothetical protein